MTCIYRNVTAFKLGSVMGSPAIMVTEAGETYVDTYGPPNRTWRYSLKDAPELSKPLNFIRVSFSDGTLEIEV